MVPPHLPRSKGVPCPPQHPPLPEDQGELGNLWPVTITSFVEPLFCAIHFTTISLILSNQTVGWILSSPFLQMRELSPRDVSNVPEITPPS